MSTKPANIGGPLASIPKSLLADALRVYVAKHPEYLAKLRQGTKDAAKITDLYEWKRKRNREYLR